MKTLHAKGTVISTLYCFILLNVMFIIMGIEAWMVRDRRAVLLIAVPVLAVVTNLYAMLGVMVAYRQNCIMYGGGKVVIRHGRIIMKKGWKYKEDEILLSELELYAVIYYHNKVREDATVVSFQPKGGQRTGYALGYYSHEQIDELFRYIQEETGLEVQVLQPA